MCCACPGRGLCAALDGLRVAHVREAAGKTQEKKRATSVTSHYVADVYFAQQDRVGQSRRKCSRGLGPQPGIEQVVSWIAGYRYEPDQKLAAVRRSRLPDWCVPGRTSSTRPGTGSSCAYLQFPATAFTSGPFSAAVPPFVNAITGPAFCSARRSGSGLQNYFCFRNWPASQSDTSGRQDRLCRGASALLRPAGIEPASRSQAAKHDQGAARCAFMSACGGVASGASLCNPKGGSAWI